MFKLGDRVELVADIVSYGLPFGKGSKGTVITDYTDGDVSIEIDDPSKKVLSYIFIIKQENIAHVKG